METRALVDELDRACPGFADYRRSVDNLFGPGSLGAVFAACSHFLRERTVPPESWLRLATLVNTVAGGSDRAASEAVCTCLLENLASTSHPLKPFLQGEALRYWSAWESAG